MDEKNNTMTIIIVVIVLLIAGLIAYFVFNNMQGNDTNVNEPTTNENENNNLDDTSDETRDVAGAYTGTYNKNTNVLEDAADAVTDNDSDRVVVELVLDEDGKATFVKSGDTDETIKGTYTTTNDQVTLTADKDENNDEAEDTADDKDTNKTYVFNINADGSLSYREDSTSTDTVTLNKTDKSNLKHIK